MRFLVPAALATLTATVAMSAAASVPVTVTGAAAVRPASTSLPTTTSFPTTARPMARVGTGAPVATPDNTRVAPRAGFTWPLAPRPAVLHRFEQPVNQWSAGHRGVDLVATVGQPVLSAGVGVVAFSGVVAGRGVITIGHPGGVSTTYEPVDRRLALGTAVHRGARIGVLAPTAGHCMPRTCLHWGARSAQGYLDPLSLLGFGRPVLLPLG